MPVGLDVISVIVLLASKLSVKTVCQVGVGLSSVLSLLPSLPTKLPDNTPELFIQSVLAVWASVK